MTRRNSLIFVAAVGLFWLVLDQWTKFLVVSHLTRLMPSDASLLERVRLFYGTDGLMHLVTRPAPILPPFWDHLYVQNPAGAFGLLASAPDSVRPLFFVVVSIGAAVGLLWMAWRTPGGGKAKMAVRVALGLVLGGALGNNLFDRLNHGYVIDFIRWKAGSFVWPPFNVADTGIVVGVIALVLLMGRGEEREAKKKKAAAGASRAANGARP